VLSKVNTGILIELILFISASALFGLIFSHLGLMSGRGLKEPCVAASHNSSEAFHLSQHLPGLMMMRNLIRLRGADCREERVNAVFTLKQEVFLQIEIKT